MNPLGERRPSRLQATSGASKSLSIVALLAAALLSALVTASAGAVVARLGGHGYGVAPMSAAGERALVAAHRQSAPATSTSARPFDEPPFGGSPLENFEEGPVMHKVTTHVVYWDPSGQFTSTTKGIVEGFLSHVANDSGLGTNTFAIGGQYTDSTGNAAYSSTFGGAILDKHAYPSGGGNCTAPNEVDKGPYATCLFDSQLQSELTTVIGEESLPKGSTQLYFVLLPHTVATCLPETIGGKQVCSNNFYCAYHSYISPGTANEVIYADIPFSLLDSSFAKGCQSDGNVAIQLPNGDKGTSNTETRFADVALKYLSHEYIEAATDPLVNFETAWVDEQGLEIADKCNSIPFEEEEEGEPGFDIHAFTPTLGGSAASGTLFNQAIDTGHYYLQSEWDNAGEACLMNPLSLGAGSFPVPSATAGSPVKFSGSATDPYGSLDPTWTFGDGEGAEGVTPTHTYALAGKYTVTMTPKDSLTGSTGTPVSHEVTVAAPIVEFPLSIEKVGTGSGDVVSTPAGIGCGGTCAANFAEGTEVTLTATPGAGSSFSGWGGPCAGTGKCKVTIDKAREVKAEFASNPKFALNVSKTGTGKGAVSSSPAGISCGAACTAEFAEGQTVTLTAIAESGSTFVRWSGGPCDGSTLSTCEVTIPAGPLSVKAEFAASTGDTGGTTGGTGALTGTATSSLTIAVSAPAPNNSFTAKSASNAKTGAITLTISVLDPGKLSWGATFANGKFGAFASSAKCKKGQIRLRGRCLPAKITFAKGSRTLAAAGSVVITLKPSASALKALKAALKQRKGVPISIVLSFQSSRGGPPVSHAQAVTVKLKK
jgi:hypothetical protein